MTFSDDKKCQLVYFMHKLCLKYMTLSYISMEIRIHTKCLIIYLVIKEKFQSSDPRVLLLMFLTGPDFQSS